MKFDYLNDKEFSEILDKSYIDIMYNLKDKRKAEEILKMWIDYMDSNLSEAEQRLVDITNEYLNKLSYNTCLLRELSVATMNPLRL